MDPTQPIYDEADVPAYSLPDPLVTAGGQPVADALQWTEQRRPEILDLFSTHVYGMSPDRPPEMTFKVNSRDPAALDGRAIRTEIVDPTGAGDALTAAVIFSMLNQIPLDDAVRLGVSAASLTLRHRGAVVPDLSLEKLYDQLVI